MILGPSAQGPPNCLLHCPHPLLELSLYSNPSSRGVVLGKQTKKPVSVSVV